VKNGSALSIKCVLVLVMMMAKHMFEDVYTGVMMLFRITQYRIGIIDLFKLIRVTTLIWVVFECQFFVGFL
jgi:hypothetical protein